MAAGTSGFIVKDTPATKTADYTLNHGRPRLEIHARQSRLVEIRLVDARPRAPTPTNA
jgi:hypothetical protein